MALSQCRFSKTRHLSINGNEHILQQITSKSDQNVENTGKIKFKRLSKARLSHCTDLKGIHPCLVNKKLLKTLP